jgi:hypothetical protein
MAQCYMGLLTFLAVQEAVQWDLRSLFYVRPSIVLFVFLFFVVVPVVQILRRTGHNPVWCLLALVPGLNFLAFWFLPRVQAMAHGQAVREYRKVKPLFRVPDKSGLCQNSLTKVHLCSAAVRPALL